MSDFSIHPGTTLGAVHLVVRDLERTALFYQYHLGFQPASTGGITTLTADGRTPLIVLHGRTEARRRAVRTTGLYHVAVRVPSRLELARLLAHLVDTDTLLSGVANHGVSEALYLSDPEGNGLEFYHDFPRDRWPRSGEQIQLVTEPLDVDGLVSTLMSHLEPWNGLHPDTTVGHVHLQVADLVASEQFYHGVLGFDKIAEIPQQAHFVSAGGYHHHIGYNVWGGVGVPAPPPGSTGLEHFAIVLPDTAALEEVAERVRKAGLELESQDKGYLTRDPAGNPVLLSSQ